MKREEKGFGKLYNMTAAAAAAVLFVNFLVFLILLLIGIQWVLDPALALVTGVLILLSAVIRFFLREKEVLPVLKYLLIAAMICNFLIVIFFCLTMTALLLG